MRLRSTKLTATAFMALGSLLGYGAASADLFRNAVGSVTTQRSKPGLRASDGLGRGSLVAQADQQPSGTKPSLGKKPNIVYFLVDNLGFGELGCYGGGVLRGTKTPRIDSFAKQGVKLLNFAPESQCTPSRSALMTGRYAIRSGNQSVPLPGSEGGLVAWEKTIADVLTPVGYTCNIVGKWHIGDSAGR